MPIVIRVTSVVLAVVAIAFLLRAGSNAAEAQESARSPSDVTKELRARLLLGTASEFSIEPASTVWAVLMETGYAEAAATLVALGDGTASLYFSSGGGVIGGGPHPSISTPARRLVRLAGNHLSGMSPTSEFPLPTVGEVKFYVLTTNGVLTAEAAEEALGAGEHQLSPLFFAGHDVITGLRKVSEERER